MSQPALAADPLRPQFHLLPPSGWMNDPNGPIVWKGKVHLFYQVNPHGADWGDISWGHAVSEDMVHWRHLPVALTPTPGFADSYGVFSGSAIADGDRCLAFYTAVEQVSDPRIATLHGDKELREQQVVAVATDPDLLHWERQKEPVIRTPPLQPTAGFRDPCIWRKGDRWYMALGSGVMGQYGAVLLYAATVPAGPRADWRYLQPLVTQPGNGRNTPDTVDAGTMWECPDFFELDGHHVLLYSTERKVFWITGSFDEQALRFVPKKRGELDSGAYYAPKSMVGKAGERILWGWIPEKRPKEQYIAAGWAGAMALPRVLSVSGDGRLRMRVAPAVDTLAAGATGAPSANGVVQGLAAQFQAAFPGRTGELAVELVTPVGAQQLLSVQLSGNGTVKVNGEAIGAPATEQVRVFADGSVIEVFFGDVAAHTVRVYPSVTGNAALRARATGGSLRSAVPMRAISPDRLTT